MSSRWARVARGAVVASVAIALAALSHAAGGGSAPGAAGLAIAIAFAVPASVAIAGRRLTLPRIAVAVTLSQLLFHLLFALGGPSSLTLVQNGHHGAVTASTTDASGLALAGLASTGLHHAGAAMWAAHAVAALLTIAYLWRAERAVWRTVAAATGRFAAVLRGRAVVLPTPSIETDVAVPTRSRRRMRDDLGVVLSAMRHRGPPASLLLL
jgi:hypothetical protein